MQLTTTLYLQTVKTSLLFTALVSLHTLWFMNQTTVV